MIAAIAETLDQIPFEQLGDSALLSRFDTKYLLPAALVPQLLAEETADYRVLTFAGRRVSRYQTDYFDTPNFDFYRDHLIGREPRCKVRMRTYVESAMTFLEVKVKTSRGNTVKVRERLVHGWDEAVAALLQGPSGRLVERVPWANLRPSIHVDYDRLTLVSRHVPERVTIDMRLTFRDDDETVVYPGVAVAEVKQARPSREGFTAALRRMNFREVSLSKYCFGIARLRAEDVKTNGYRRIMNRMQQNGGEQHVA